MAADTDSRSTRDTQGADPMADHKRRARWRLLGAIIITGAVAAIAPILLEDQARPLSQDLLIEIPSKNSVFSKIDTLKPGASGANTAAASSEPASSEPAPAPEPAKPAQSAEPTPAPASDKSAEKKAVEKKTVEKKAAEQKATEKKTEQKAEKKADKKVEKPAPTAQSGFLVQVGAYAKLESANAVRAKLTAGGHSVQIQTIKLDDGSERHRVRIGPFETRDQAIAVRDRAKSQGYDAVVANPQ